MGLIMIGGKPELDRLIGTLDWMLATHEETLHSCGNIP